MKVMDCGIHVKICLCCLYTIYNTNNCMIMQSAMIRTYFDAQFSSNNLKYFICLKLITGFVVGFLVFFLPFALALIFIVSFLLHLFIYFIRFLVSEWNISSGNRTFVFMAELHLASVFFPKILFHFGDGESFSSCVSIWMAQNEYTFHSIVFFFISLKRWQTLV